MVHAGGRNKSFQVLETDWRLEQVSAGNESDLPEMGGNL